MRNQKDEDLLLSNILKMQDENACWNVLTEGEKYFPVYNYYVPNFKSTLWTLILLADMGISPNNPQLLKPLQILSSHFYDDKVGIFTIGKSHFPIPCLNGNMLYLHAYYRAEDQDKLDRLIDFFEKYQRFDDGDYKTPSTFPYNSNKSCYGSHTCYWGVVKLLKGISFIPVEKRSDKTKQLSQRCIEFILQHEVCYSSHKPSLFLHPNIHRLTFPNMYQSDFLEILWILMREGVVSPQLNRAIELLESKRKNDGTWPLERPIKNLIVSLGKKKVEREYITPRALEVMNFYSPVS